MRERGSNGGGRGCNGGAEPPMEVQGGSKWGVFLADFGVWGPFLTQFGRIRSQ